MGSESCPPGPNPNSSSSSRLAGRTARRCARACDAPRAWPGRAWSVGGCVRRARVAVGGVPRPRLSSPARVSPPRRIPLH
eukprot:277798-Prymnesium_polylepis.1